MIYIIYLLFTKKRPLLARHIPQIIFLKAEFRVSCEEFFRNKVRAKVSDPVVAEDLCAKDFPLFTKRLCLETNYFETFNLPKAKLVNLHRTPIESITETGIDTTEE